MEPPIEPPKRFLGRTFDVNTRTWKHPDGSGGVITEEHRQEIYLAHDNCPMYGISGLLKKWEIQERMDKIKREGIQ